MLQFKRLYRLTIGDSSTGEAVIIEPPLNISFSIEKRLDNSKSLNTAKFSVFNLSEDTRKRFERLKYPYISFECGYEQAENLATVFIGQATTFASAQNGSGDVVTNIEAAEAFVQLFSPVIPYTVPQNTSVGEILTSVVKNMQQISLGTVATNFKKQVGSVLLTKNYKEKTLEKKLAEAYPVEGVPFKIFAKFAKDYKLEWRIDRNRIYFKDSSGTFSSPSQTVFQINSSSGLIGLPEFKDNKRGKSLEDESSMVGITFKCLINPSLMPAAMVNVVSEGTSINGVYFLRNIKMEGEYMGNNWYMDIEADEVKRNV